MRKGVLSEMHEVIRARVRIGVVGTVSFVSGLAAAAGDDDGIVVVANAESVEELARTADTLDVVVLHAVPKNAAVDVVRSSHGAFGAAKLIVVVPTDSGPSDVRRLLRAGADGVLHELELDRTLVAAVAVIQAGSVCVPRRLSSAFADEVLSMREKQILGLAVRGANNQEIARRLFVAEATVKSHLSSAYAKLGVRTRQEAIAMILDPAEGLGPGILTIAAGREDSVTDDPTLDRSGAEKDERTVAVRVPQHVVYRSLANETVLLDLRTGLYYGLNETAGRMLSALESQPDIDSVIAQIAGELDAPPDQLRSDLLALIDGLAGEGLLELETVAEGSVGDH